MPPAAQGSLVRRLAAYTTERFPLAAYVPMILLAAFAALGYSRVARGAPGFASLTAFATTTFTLLAAFLALRVADEHKDATLDRLTRPELPVPRGLVTLGELRAAALGLAIVAIAANALVDVRLLLPITAASLWLALMTREFFARDWLRSRPASYLASHMVIMPLLLLYATAVDWLAAGADAPRSIPVFLAATYAIGLVLEVGRKIRSVPDERPGVETYTATWGAKRAIAVWLLAVAISAMLVAGSAHAVASSWALGAAPIAAAAVGYAALGFVQRPDRPGEGRRIATASALWTLAAYALLALPWIERAIT